MTEHRGLQVLRAMKAALLDATNAGSNVELGRSSNVTDSEAIDLKVGPEAVLSVDVNRQLLSQTFYADLHTRTIEHEEDVLANLFALKSQAHAALLADPTLGLAFVSQIKFVGSEALLTETGGERLGAVRTLWEVEFWIDYDDPAT